MTVMAIPASHNGEMHLQSQGARSKRPRSFSAQSPDISYSIFMVDNLHSLAAVLSGQLDPADVSPDAWLQLADLAVSHLVGPLLLHRTEAAGIVLPSPVRSQLTRVARQAAAHYLALGLAHQQVDAALRARDISPIWIKGIVLAHTAYPDPYLRSMSDLDVLVPPDSRETAVKVLAALGYGYQDDPAILLLSSGDPLARRWAGHHDHLHGGPTGAVVLELHTRLIADESLLPTNRMAWFFSQTTSYSVDGHPYQTLTPTAHLLYLCAHSQLQHQFPLLRWSYDLHRLVQVSSPDWPVVVEQAARLRWTAAVERALTGCRALFGTSLPPALLDDLRAARLPDENPARLNTYRGPGGRWRKTREHLVSLPLADRLRLLTRIIFPAPAYMRRRYNVPSDRPLWLVYLARWRIALREILAAARRGNP